VVSSQGLAAVREFVGRRFPALKDAPLVASEVCQYENSSNGDFLVDRHPDFDDVWLVGAAPATASSTGPPSASTGRPRRDGAPVDAKFSLATSKDAGEDGLLSGRPVSAA